MKKVMANPNDSDMLDEYDFSNGIRGKYAQRYREGTNLVKLDEDVAALFPSAREVNEALRALGKIIKNYETHDLTKGS